MKRIMPTLALSLCFSAAYVGAVGAFTPAAAQEANGFGEKGQLIITADRLMPLLSYSRQSVDTTQGNVTTTESESSTSFALLLGREPTDPGFVNPHTIPRIAFDYAVIPHLTVGGSIVVGIGIGGSVKTESSGGGTSNTTSNDAPTVTALGFAPRAGYVLPLGSQFAFWPRAGFAFYSLSTSTTTTGNAANANTDTKKTDKDTVWSLDLDPQLVWVPIQHFFIHAGPIVNIPLAGSRSQKVEQGGTTQETSNDFHAFHIGLSAGLGGWFDL